MDQGAHNVTLARAFVEELARSQVRHACICPGSRSAPLAMMLARHDAIRTWVSIDERSAAFFGLGLARALGEPVALLCSSGTAAANFLPAVVEAYYSRVPLVVLTADRPPELRDTGAAQTIDQLRLYGSHVKWFADLPLPEATDDLLRQIRTSAARAVATARAGPAGPVHLNFPFREPLVPAPDAAGSVPVLDPLAQNGRADDRPYVAVTAGRRLPDSSTIARLAAELAPVSRGLLVCGPQDDPALAPAVVALAGAFGYPVLADPLSQVRGGPHDRTLVIDSYDAFLRDDATCRALAPDVVIRFGALPTSKPLVQYLQRYPACRQIVIDGDGGWRDPLLLAAEVVHADPRALCLALAGTALARYNGRSRDSWADEWQQTAATTRIAIARQIAAGDEPFEGRVFAELAALLPDGATLFAGNSMPVRDLDTFFLSGERQIRCLANRGANGIDGVVSSALGVAAATDAPLVLVIGDLSFYHDLNGLLAARKYGLNATIVVINNDGGGIFSFLPQAAYSDTFEECFGTPTGLDFAAAATLYGASFTRPADWPAFREALHAGLTSDSLSIVEVVTDRARNVTQHRAVWQAVAAEVRASAVTPAVV